MANKLKVQEVDELCSKFVTKLNTEFLMKSFFFGKRDKKYQKVKYIEFFRMDKLLGYNTEKELGISFRVFVHVKNDDSLYKMGDAVKGQTFVKNVVENENDVCFNLFREDPETNFMDSTVIKRIFSEDGILVNKTQFHEGFVKGKGETPPPIAVPPPAEQDVVELERLRNENTTLLATNATLIANNARLDQGNQTLGKKLRERLQIVEKFHIEYKQ
jgi:hypothetical protein